MWGFVWEPVIAATIASVLALAGVILTVRSQSKQTRQAGLAQHQDQDKKLDQLIHAHMRMEQKIDENKNVAEKGLAELSGQVKGVMETTETLFGLIVQVDKKATSRGNKVTKPLKVMEDATSE